MRVGRVPFASWLWSRRLTEPPRPASSAHISSHSALPVSRKADALPPAPAGAPRTSAAALSAAVDTRELIGDHPTLRRNQA